MPYIEDKYREMIDEEIDALIEKMHLMSEVNKEFSVSMRAGILNYVITRVINGLIGLAVRYSKINEVIGALECCKLELYRRVAAPYEDEKIKSNGDVY